MPEEQKVLDLDDLDVLKVLADEAGVTLYLNYSGRGMYGKTCLGVYGGEESLDRFADLAREEYPDAGIRWRRPEVDSLGYDTIHYWKNLNT